MAARQDGHCIRAAWFLESWCEVQITIATGLGQDRLILASMTVESQIYQGWGTFNRGEVEGSEVKTSGTICYVQEDASVKRI